MKLFTLLSLFLIGTVTAFSQSSCPANMNFSMGDFTNWQCYTGTVTSPNCSTNVVSVVPGAPIPGRHILLPPNQSLDPFGGFPLTLPNVSYIARLGFVGQTGAQVEKISYTFTVPSTVSQYSLTFLFAVVYQDPSHCAGQQPHFEARVYDSTTSQYIDCSSVSYFATAGASGFIQSTNTSQGSVYYRPWTPFTAILDSYIGHTLRLEFTNADCTAGGHWAYSYIAVPNNASCTSPALGNYICPGSNAVVTGPYGYQSYNWWNTSFTQNLGTGQTLSLTTPPTTATTYALDLVSYAGAACRDTVMVTVQPSNTIAAATAGPDVVLCSAGASATIGAPPVAGLSYSWTPATGLTPNASQQTVTPNSTTTYVMTAVDGTSGCTKVDTVTVFVNSVPSGFTINNTTQCLPGNNYQFNMTSTVAGSSYVWDFGDGSTSTTQNPAHVYATAGSFTVKVKVTSASGCKDSTSHAVNVVGALSAATVSLSGNVLTSSSPAGNQWYLNGVAIPGATGQTYTATAAGTYTVVVSVNNCSSPVSNAVTYSVTGIDAIVAEWKLQIAPNPTNDKLIINYSSNQKLDLKLFDMTGRMIYCSRGIPSAYTVDLSKFQSGSYMIQLINPKTNQEVKRLIVKS